MCVCVFDSDVTTIHAAPYRGGNDNKEEAEEEIRVCSITSTRMFIHKCLFGYYHIGISPKLVFC